MSLFALNHEYQRSFDRIWEEFSAHSRAQSEPAAPEQVERKSRHSLLNSGYQGEVRLQHESADMPQGTGEPEWIQHDAKAWGHFLDSKRKY